MDFDRSVFWPEFAAAGFLRRASVKQKGKPVAIVSVRYEEPDIVMFNGGTSSKEYAIEYQDSELPALAEGDPVQLLDDDDVPIAKAKFVVRQVPMVAENPNANNDLSGYFKRALLTKL